MLLFAVLPLNLLTLDSPYSLTPDHPLLDSAPNLDPLMSRWEINKFQNCWYKSVRILEVLKHLFHQSLNLSSSKRDMSGPILGALSNNRWSWGSFWTTLEPLHKQDIWLDNKAETKLFHVLKSITSITAIFKLAIFPSWLSRVSKLGKIIQE